MSTRRYSVLAALLLISLLHAVAIAEVSDAAVAKPAANEKPGWLDATKAMSESQGSAATAPSAAPVEKPWEVKFKLNTWIPNYHGSVGVRNTTSTLDVSCNDVFRVLDEVTCMVPINLEARYDKWGFIADLFYVRLKDSQKQGPVSVGIESTQTILEIAGFYRVGTCPVCPDGKGLLTFDVLGGARYNRFSGSVGLDTPRNSVNVGGAKEWWDPFVGPRVTLQATDKLSLSLRADVGGFGIKNCSNFVWQLVASAEYSITDNFFVEVGYRLLDTDYERGSGGTRFAYDVTMSGPYLGLGLKF